MYSLIGVPLEEAKTVLTNKNINYKITRYNSRFKEDVLTDSFRVVRQRQENDGTIELVVSDFKTISQSR